MSYFKLDNITEILLWGVGVVSNIDVDIPWVTSVVIIQKNWETTDMLQNFITYIIKTYISTAF